MKRHTWSSLLLGYGLVILLTFFWCPGAFRAISYENIEFPFPNAYLSYRIDEAEIYVPHYYVPHKRDSTSTFTSTLSLIYTDITATTYKRTLQRGSSFSFAEFSLATGDDFWIPPSKMKNMTYGETVLSHGYDSEPIFGKNFVLKPYFHDYSILYNQIVDVWKFYRHPWTLYFTKEEGLLVGAFLRTESIAFYGPDLVHTINYTLTSTNIRFSYSLSQNQSTSGFEVVSVLVLLGTLGRFVLRHKRSVR